MTDTKTLMTKGISATAAASLLILTGCAIQPSQPSQTTSSDYAQADTPASDPAAPAADPPPTDKEHGGQWHHGHGMMNPYFRTQTSTTEATVTVEGNSIHYHAVAGLLVVHPEGWDDATGKNAGEDPMAEA
ncbi:MAG TPA: hypothetical protein VN750_07805, partial [Steroidobacteraceae bacterium]|nr:hypothetical protein [Steroidobacteraceae bacterium]